MGNDLRCYSSPGRARNRTALRMYAALRAVPRPPAVLTSLVLVVLTAAVFLPRQAPAQPAAPASTDHRLVGTVEGTVFSGAVFIDPAGQQQFYRINETLPDGSRLIAVRQESVLVRRQDGMTYEVFIYRELRTAVPASPSPSVVPRERDERGEPERRQPPRRFRSSAEETPDE